MRMRRTNTPRKPSRYRLTDALQVRSNLELTMRERGKIVARRKGHNIWLNLGRQYLAQLITYNSFSGSTGTPLRNDRMQYMGLGIGGNRQLALTTANASPLGASPPSPNGAYPGTNAQTDTDPTVTTLERPVRVSGGVTVYPYYPSDVWLSQVEAPAWSVDDVPYDSTFSVLFEQTDISYAPYLTVPLSEVALFTSAANVNIYNNTAVAYDTFDTISKTNAFDLEIQWVIRF
jgi:hypothetical protein